jgi:hypothetical protein
MNEFSMWQRSVGVRLIQVGVCASLLSACVGEAVVGEETDGDTSSSTGGSEGGDGDGAPALKANAFGDLAGTRWEGYYEGGEDVTVILGTDGSGSIFLGDAAKQPAPPTDPDLGYLCEGDIESTCSPYQVNNGWNYPIQEGLVQGRRFQFSVPLGDPWVEWCALQTPQVWQENEGESWYGVGPNLGGGNDEGGCFVGFEEDKEYVDCGWYFLAQRMPVCECTATKCEASSSSKSEFDLTSDADFTELSNEGGLHLFRVD